MEFAGPCWPNPRITRGAPRYERSPRPLMTALAGQAVTQRTDKKAARSLQPAARRNGGLIMYTAHTHTHTRTRSRLIQRPDRSCGSNVRK